MQKEKSRESEGEIRGWKGRLKGGRGGVWQGGKTSSKKLIFRKKGRNETS